jgi:hypothetical protein
VQPRRQARRIRVPEQDVEGRRDFRYARYALEAAEIVVVE